MARVCAYAEHKLAKAARIKVPRAKPCGVACKAPLLSFLVDRINKKACIRRLFVIAHMLSSQGRIGDVAALICGPASPSKCPDGHLPKIFTALFSKSAPPEAVTPSLPFLQVLPDMRKGAFGAVR